MGEKNNSKSNEVKVDPVQETKVVSETRKCMIKLSKNKTNIENFIRLQENMAEEAKVITTFLPLNRNTCFQEKEVLEAQTEGNNIMNRINLIFMKIGEFYEISKCACFLKKFFHSIFTFFNLLFSEQCSLMLQFLTTDLL